MFGLLWKIAAKMKEIAMGAIRRTKDEMVLIYFMPVSGFVNNFVSRYVSEIIAGPNRA